MQINFIENFEIIKSYMVNVKSRLNRKTCANGMLMYSWKYVKTFSLSSSSPCLPEQMEEWKHSYRHLDTFHWLLDSSRKYFIYCCIIFIIITITSVSCDCNGTLSALFIHLSRIWSFHFGCVYVCVCVGRGFESQSKVLLNGIMVLLYVMCVLIS